MADEKEANGAEVQEEPASSTKKKSPIMLILLLVNTMVVLALVSYMVFSKSSTPAQTEESATEEPVAVPQKKIEHIDDDSLIPEGGGTVTLDPFLVNLLDSAGQRYLKLTVVVVVDNEELTEELEVRKAQLKHSVIGYLRGLRYKDTIGPGGQEEIMENIHLRLNRIVTKGKIKKVYFTEFVIQ